MSDTPEEIVTKFCDAWGEGDMDTVYGLLSDDCSYHNIPLDPVHGLDAIKATIDGFTANATKVEDGPVAAESVIAMQDAGLYSIAAPTEVGGGGNAV